MGTRLLPHARKVVEAARVALASVQSECGAIRLGATESISSFLIPLAVSAVAGEGDFPFPEVTIGLCSELRALVVAGRLDLCITMESGLPAQDSAVTCSQIGTVSLTVFAGANAAGMGVDGWQGEQAELLVPDPGGSLTSHVQGWIDREGICARLRSAGSIDGVKRSVRLGDAMGVLPMYALADELDGGTVRLVEVPRLHPMTLLATVGTCADNPAACGSLVDAIAATV